jgi:hypothetical protein
VTRAVAILSFLIVTSSSGPAAAAAACSSFDHDHVAWTALLERYVRGGVVDYRSWSHDGPAPLDAYLASLAEISPACFRTFTREQQMAFLIDAYNASTVRLVLEHYPIASIRKIGFLPGAAFREAFIPLRAIDEEKVSLDDIEHGTLRKQYDDPRIHFALVCAARSCPPLRSEAFRGSALSAQLDDQGRTFLGDPAKNRFDAARDTLFVSRIFDWFAGDFVKAKGSVAAFLVPYLPEAAARAAAGPAPKLEFLDYDWSLNGS